MSELGLLTHGRHQQVGEQEGAVVVGTHAAVLAGRAIRNVHHA